MTDGHKHRHIVVPSWDRWYVRLLRKPLIHHKTLTHNQYKRIDESPYPYGPCAKHGNRRTDPLATCWCLSPLGILHRWTGLTLVTRDE